MKRVLIILCIFIFAGDCLAQGSARLTRKRQPTRNTRDDVNIMRKPISANSEQQFQRGSEGSLIRYRLPSGSMTLSYPTGSREKVLVFNFERGGANIVPVSRTSRSTSSADVTVFNNPPITASYSWRKGSSDRVHNY